MPNDNPTPAPAPAQQQMALQIRYEDMSARYANHVLLNSGQEELYLDFSSGLVIDPGAGVSVMPIHTRIAMTPAAIVRLWQLLGQAVQNFQVIQTGPSQPQPPTPIEPPAAEGQPAQS